MWKTAFFFGMMLSLEVSANTCNIESVEGIVALLKQAPQEKHYKSVNDRLLDLQYEEATRRSRPSFSAGITQDKDNSRNKEITTEVLFDIDGFRNFGIQKKAGQSARELKKVEFDRDYNERLNQVALSFFKISQNKFFLEKIEGLLNTIISSEAIYKTRPIRSRDDEIILSSLGLLKSTLSLKKSRLQDRIFEDRLNVSKWDEIACDIDYKNLTKIIHNLKLDKKNDKDLLSLKELKWKREFAENSIELEDRKYLSNLKIGPSFSREKNNEINEYRFGLALSFDIPTLSNSNRDYIYQSKLQSSLDKKRGEINANHEKSIFEDRFKKYSQSLENLPTSEKLEADIKKIKKSFDSGVVSPLVYLESYRSYIEFLEGSEEVRLNLFESYLKLRGLYVENNSF